VEKHLVEGSGVMVTVTERGRALLRAAEVRHEAA
jgi:hypothetical protein